MQPLPTAEEPPDAEVRQVGVVVRGAAQPLEDVPGASDIRTPALRDVQHEQRPATLLEQVLIALVTYISNHGNLGSKTVYKPQAIA